MRIGVAFLIVLAAVIFSVGKVEAAACPLVKTCSSDVNVPGVGTHHVNWTGIGDATVTGTSVDWSRITMNAQSSVLGNLTATLDPSHSSTGTLSSTSFPALMHNDLRLAINCTDTGIVLVSDSPFQIEATINSVPPTATYTQVGGPVNFYRQGDPAKTTVATLTTATVNVSPRTSSSVPTLSEWGVIFLVMCLLAAGTLFVMRRRVNS